MKLDPHADSRIAGVRLLGFSLERELDLYDLLHELEPLRFYIDCRPQYGPLPGVVVGEREWRKRDFDLDDCDRKLSAAASRSQWLNLEFETLGGLALFQVLTRYQRFIARSPAANQSDLFTRVLEAHLSLHDLDKPLVKADFDHALDVWYWTLRLMPSASHALQWAALFHDVERLNSEATVRIEHLAPNYQSFKDAHAIGSARVALDVLRRCGVREALCRQVSELIHGHERPRSFVSDTALEVLADADSLSFFSLNSSGFLDYYGRSHTEKKIAYTLGRMSPRARSLVHRLKLRRDVETLLQSAIIECPKEVRTYSEVSE